MPPGIVGRQDFVRRRIKNDAPPQHWSKATAVVGLTGFEPATSWSRTKDMAIQTREKQGEEATHGDGLHSCLHQSDDSAPPSAVAAGLAMLFGNLAEADRIALARLLLRPSLTSPNHSDLKDYESGK